MTKELDNLLSVIFQSGGKIEVKDSQLWVGPPAIAKRFGDQIKRLKPEIMIALGHCPVCSKELRVKVEKDCLGMTGRHAHCSGEEILHYDEWKF